MRVVEALTLSNNLAIMRLVQYNDIVGDLLRDDCQQVTTPK